MFEKILISIIFILIYILVINLYNKRYIQRIAILYFESKKDRKSLTNIIIKQINLYII